MSFFYKFYPVKCKYNEVETDPLDDSILVYKCNPYNLDELEYEVEKSKKISTYCKVLGPLRLDFDAPW